MDRVPGLGAEEAGTSSGGSCLDAPAAHGSPAAAPPQVYSESAPSSLGHGPSLRRHRAACLLSSPHVSSAKRWSPPLAPNQG
eukprot:3660217-Rhodomonas_salina.1